jgi:GMP synthase (glutamine-hydrolysing)
MTSPLNIHSLQHAPFEGPASIGDWISARSHRLTATHLYRREVLPSLESVDWIVVMGGPMNVYEYRLHPWLREEKHFLAAALGPTRPFWASVSARSCWPMFSEP